MRSWENGPIYCLGKVNRNLLETTGKGPVMTATILEPDCLVEQSKPLTSHDILKARAILLRLRSAERTVLNDSKTPSWFKRAAWAGLHSTNKALEYSLKNPESKNDGFFVRQNMKMAEQMLEGFQEVR